MTLGKPKLYDFLKKLYDRFIFDEVPALSSQLSYSLVLAFFPFLIFVLTLVGYTPLTNERVLSGLVGILPDATYHMVIDITKDILIKRSSTLLSISMLGTLWASSNGISALIIAFNKAYNHAESRHFIMVKSMTIFYTIGLALVIIIIFFLIIFGEVIGKYIFEAAGYSYYFRRIWNIVRYIVSLLFVFIVILMLYYFLPNKKLCFKEVIPGSIFSTIAWVGISLAFSFYINNFTGYTATYGSIGGILILLLWLYWSSVILIMGVELNAVLVEK